VSPVDIAVIIVNYNTALLTIDAISSVLAEPHAERSVHTYVVDNASPQGDFFLLERAISERDWASRVTLVGSTKNVGFGAGNNLVLREIAEATPSPRYVFLLNPDARLNNDVVGILADFLDAHPAAAAVGAGIWNPQGKPVTAAFRFPGILSTFAEALAFGPVTRALRRWETPLPPTTSTQRVDWVAGAAVMLRLPEIWRAGLFDPSYFLYYEEVDLMRQLARQGCQVWHVAEAHVVHVEGAATGVKSGNTFPKRLPTYWYASWQHYFLKNHGRFAAILAASAWYTGAAGNAAIAYMRGRTSQTPDRFYRDFWCVAVRPLLGLRPLPYD